MAGVSAGCVDFLLYRRGLYSLFSTVLDLRVILLVCIWFCLGAGDLDLGRFQVPCSVAGVLNRKLGFAIRLGGLV